MNGRNKNYNTYNDMTQSNVECILTSGRSIESLPASNDHPYMIIKYGPTGSGKGSEIVTKEIVALGVPIQDYAVFEIDSLVESIKLYRNKTLEIAQNKTKNSHSKYKNLEEEYFKTRKSPNQSGKSLNDKMDTALNEAIKLSKNIIFETTGTYFSFSNPLKWLIDLVSNTNKNYRIVVIYPLVSTNELISRVQKRAQMQLTRKNKPLYRGINASRIEPLANYAKMNLTHFILPELYAKRIYKLITVWNE